MPIKPPDPEKNRERRIEFATDCLVLRLLGVLNVADATERGRNVAQILVGLEANLLEVVDAVDHALEPTEVHGGILDPEVRRRYAFKAVREWLQGMGRE